MRVSVQHNILIHVRIVVPTVSVETARNVLNMKGWVCENVLPMHRGLFSKDSERMEIIASHHLATSARSGDAMELVQELINDLGAA